MMSSRLLLLVLAALAACLRSGRAQDPLPPSLVDLVMNSPISSVDDLKRLLDVESVEEDDEKPENEVQSNGTHRRLPRSLNVQVAQQAMCKVRTEVMEVTRSMLDRRNANFLLWPPCVEVQRCSGCCNTRILQCTPVTTETRHLQMTKIQFINRQPVYEKVVIPVEDHVTCSCQSRVSAHPPRLQTTPLPPHRLHQKVTLPKKQSKEELHRNDELKHNQRLHLEDRESQEVQWQSKYTVTHTQGYRQSPYQHTNTPVYTSRGDVPTRPTTLGDPRMMSDTTQTEEVEHMKSENSGDGMTKKTQQHYDKHPQEDQQTKQNQTTPQQPKNSPTHNSVQSEHSMPDSSQLDGLSHTYSHVEVIGQSSGLSEAPNHHSDQSEVRKHHHHHHHHHQSEASNQNKQERERQQEETQHHLRHQQHRHHQLHQHTTQAVSQQQTSAQRTAPPSTPSATQTAPPLQPPRKHRRKHRRRMSKASMRALIMVMS
ncbi:adenylate cyclase, terminal-differentiation specific-like isoform X2 [Carassius carassius]|uniref:adenylate cyclase, terminal-differentiation specific-like isoform X2 n=1 Tax=Carassius carassius TaxID=217509 RepID=UPI002868DCE2|nr:adenylate cyclase, terminal-differentiation specific-like isoform X2 [Carassius carassius]